MYQYVQFRWIRCICSLNLIISIPVILLDTLYLHVKYIIFVLVKYIIFVLCMSYISTYSSLQYIPKRSHIQLDWANSYIVIVKLMNISVVWRGTIALNKKYHEIIIITQPSCKKIVYKESNMHIISLNTQRTFNFEHYATFIKRII